jgi:hypothetical protein
VPAVLARFRRLELPEVPDEALPLVAGILTAACVGLNPFQWRTGLGPVERPEGLVWAYTAWLVVDFMDNAVFGEKPGQFAEIVTATLAAGPDEDE